jgi:hypothetical protein
MNMKTEELAEVLLVSLDEHPGTYCSLNAAANMLGVTDRAKVNEAANWLSNRGLAKLLLTAVGPDAQITAPRRKLVEEGGRTGAIQKYRESGHCLSPFPRGHGPSLTRDEVVNYLVALQAAGHRVEQGGHEDAFNLVLDDTRRILFYQEFPNQWRVQHEVLGNRVVTGKAENLPQLDAVVAEAARLCGKQWPSPPTTGRLFADTPATNYRTIATLVGTSEVQAVFDPYLDNASLATLIDILSYGDGKVANGVRLLGSTKKTTGTSPKLTKVGVHAWLTQLGINGEARVMPPDEHRRFLLLSGGQSLLLGHSLNAIHKNEAIRLEPDAEDRAFFDGVWATATPLT